MGQVLHTCLGPADCEALINEMVYGGLGVQFMGHVEGQGFWILFAPYSMLEKQ